MKSKLSFLFTMFSVGFFLTCSRFCLAAETLELNLLEVPASAHDEVTTTFGVNKELGRAWIEVTVVEQLSSWGGEEGDYRTTSYKKRSPGLAYNSELKEVFYQSPTQRVVCSTLEKRRFLFFTFEDIVETGNCPIKVVKETREEDDGFEVRTQDVHKVSLQVLLN